MGRNVAQIDRRLLSLGFPLRGGNHSHASLKRRVMASGVMLLRRMRKVKIPDNDNERNGVDSCKLWVLCAPGDMTKNNGGGNGYGSFLVSSLSLISIARQQ